MKQLITAICAAIVAYFIGAFLVFDPHPGNWKEGYRVGTVLMWFVLMAFSYIKEEVL